MSAPLYGLLAEFETAEALLTAAKKAYAEGYREMDAYSPFPIEGLAEAIGFKKTRVPLVVLIGGITGGLTAYAMQYYSAVWNYPLNVGGRPLHSWPAFVPVTFELTLLFAAFAAVFGMLLMNGLPRFYHPVFNVPEFKLASQTRFFLCVKAVDQHFLKIATASFLKAVGALAVRGVEK
jgi:hypothetical protein